MYSKICVQNNLQKLYNPYLCWCNNIELSTEHYKEWEQGPNGGDLKKNKEIQIY